MKEMSTLSMDSKTYEIVDKKARETIEEVKGNIPTVDTSDKMDKLNPTGSGTLIINENTNDGENNTLIGTDNIIKGNGNTLLGEGNRFVGNGTSVEGQNNSNISTKLFELSNFTAEVSSSGSYIYFKNATLSKLNKDLGYANGNGWSYSSYYAVINNKYYKNGSGSPLIFNEGKIASIEFENKQVLDVLTQSDITQTIVEVYDKPKFPGFTDWYKESSYCHVEGQENMGGSFCTHIEGYANADFGSHCHTEGYMNSNKGGIMTHVEGAFNETNRASQSHLEGNKNKMLGMGMGQHVEGNQNVTMGSASAIHMEGDNNISEKGNVAHIEGYKNKDSNILLATLNNPQISLANNILTIQGTGNLVSSYYGYLFAKIDGDYYKCNELYEIGSNNHDTLTISYKSSTKPILSSIEFYNCESFAGMGMAFHIEGQYNTGNGGANHTEGFSNINIGDSKCFTHVEGSHNYNNSANKSHIEGYYNQITDGEVIHIEGSRIISSGGDNSHIEGFNIKGDKLSMSHVEGNANIVENLMASHVEGMSNVINNSGSFIMGSHVEGSFNSLQPVSGANVSHSHLEGSQNVIKNGMVQHVEGRGNIVESTGDSHTEGYQNKTYGYFSHIEGKENINNTTNSHIEGSKNSDTIQNNPTAIIGTIKFSSIAYNTYSNGNPMKNILICTPVENYGDITAIRNYLDDSENTDIYVKVNNSYCKFEYKNSSKKTPFEIYGSSDFSAIPTEREFTVYKYNPSNESEEGYECNHIEGYDNTHLGKYSHVEGYKNFSLGVISHIEGKKNNDQGDRNHTEGQENVQYYDSYNSHTEGYKNQNYEGSTCHLEGSQNIIQGGENNHIEGVQNSIKSSYCIYSHVEGCGCTVWDDGESLHLEGEYSTVYKYSLGSHVEGCGSRIYRGDGAHAEGYYSLANGIGSHVEGNNSVAKGETSHAEGEQTCANGNYSHAEGSGSYAMGESSHAEGAANTANTKYSHAEGLLNFIDRFRNSIDDYIKFSVNSYNKSTKVMTTKNHTNKYNGGFPRASLKLPSKTYLYMIYFSTPFYDSSLYEDKWNSYKFMDYCSFKKTGTNTYAVDSTQHICNNLLDELPTTGSNAAWIGIESDTVINFNTTELEGSHIEGSANYISGNWSHVEGRLNDATKADYAHVEGICNSTTNMGSHVAGMFAKKPTDGRTFKTQLGDVLVIGNGTSDNQPSDEHIEFVPSNALRVTYGGDVLTTKAYQSSGADYAEYIYEWHDGNKDKEDRIGYFVTIKGKKLYKATSKSVITGITSGNPSIIGNSDEDYIHKYERDKFNRIVWEDTTDEEGNIIHNSRMKLNKDYNPDLQNTYVHRNDRPEWDAVGMIGVLPVRDDGTCIEDEWCVSNDEGIATYSGVRTMDSFLVLERIDENTIKVLIK